MSGARPVQNWAGSYTYRATALHEPRSVEELQEIVAGAPSLHALGTRHSFTAVADAGELVSVAHLPDDVTVDHDAMTATVPAAIRYGDLAVRLEAEGVALANLASLPHVCVGGAVATGTHGSGDRNGNLATAVRALELVDGRGELVNVRRGERGFDGMVVSLGRLGVVTRLTLDVEPHYLVRQRVFERLSWDALAGDFDAITRAGHSVSVFTTWGDDAGDVWVKSRAGDAGPTVVGNAFPAGSTKHPIPGWDDLASCTAQLGEEGPWWDRLPHFRLAHDPSHGEEIQSELFVAREDAVPAIDAVRRLGPLIRPHLYVSEIRTIAADDLWLSPHHGRDSVAIHCTWKPDPPAVRRAIGRIEAALEPFSPRPHWGKAFHLTAAQLAARYERLPDFLDLVSHHDPSGVFANDWTDTHLLGR